MRNIKWEIYKTRRRSEIILFSFLSLFPFGLFFPFQFATIDIAFYCCCDKTEMKCEYSFHNWHWNDRLFVQTLDRVDSRQCFELRMRWLNFHRSQEMYRHYCPKLKNQSLLSSSTRVWRSKTLTLNKAGSLSLTLAKYSWLRRGKSKMKKSKKDLLRNFTFTPRLLESSIPISSTISTLKKLLAPSFWSKSLSISLLGFALSLQPSNLNLPPLLILFNNIFTLLSLLSLNDFLSHTIM